MSNIITTKLNEIEKSILDLIYDKYNQYGSVASVSIFDLGGIKKKLRVNENEIEKAIRKFRDYHLLETNSNIDCRCTLSSVLTFEKNFAIQTVYINNKIRRDILTYLNDGFEKDANLAWEYDDFVRDKKLSAYSQQELLRNLWVLNELNFIRGSFMLGGDFHFVITAEGRDLVSDSLKLKSTFPTSSNERISLDSVAEIVEKWIPRQKRKSEEAYKAELAEYLRNNGFPRTTEERGESACDVLVEETVPVELKKDPDKAELDRLSGQMLDMLTEYGCVVACIVRATRGDLIKKFSKRFKNDKNVKIIIKGG